MNQVLHLELTLASFDTEIDQLLAKLVECRKQQERVRGELHRARRLEREELQGLVS